MVKHRQKEGLRIVKRKGATDGSVSDNGRMSVMVPLHVATLASGLGKFPTTYLIIIIIITSLTLITH